ncbi:unnamed protein product [Closterium sp. NIES-53]
MGEKGGRRGRGVQWQHALCCFTAFNSALHSVASLFTPPPSAHCPPLSSLFPPLSIGPLSPPSTPLIPVCVCPLSPLPLHSPLSHSISPSSRCPPVRESATRVPFFPAPPGLTCPLLLDIFDLSPQELLESNQAQTPPFQCHLCDSTCLMAPQHQTLPLPPRPPLLPSPPPPLTLPPTPATPIPPPPCSAYVCRTTPTPPRSRQLGYSKLFRINPALYCDQLLPGAAGWDDSVCDTVCMMVDEWPDSGGMPCETSRFYLVKRGDTCGKLIASRYKKKVNLFRSLNGGYDCTVSSLWVGMQLCLP